MESSPLRRRWFFIGMIGVAGLVGVIAGGAIGGHYRFTRPDPTRIETRVLIAKGSGISGILRELKTHGILTTPLDSVIILAAASQLYSSLKAGEYLFPAGSSLQDIVARMARGDVIVRRIVLAEGLTSAEMMTLLQQAEGTEGTVADLPPDGSLLPETYHYSWGDQRETLVARMHTAITETLDALWRDRAPDAPQDQRQAVILASIVEKETGLEHERPRIAGVFLNRLRLGMKLQSDPTVFYGLQGVEPRNGPRDRSLTKADLAHSSPYNTYLVEGLPPGPICNPGKAALWAVLHPERTDALYFVADGTGGHVFAPTLADHNRNVARWRTIERERRNAASLEAADPGK